MGEFFVVFCTVGPDNRTIEKNEDLGKKNSEDVFAVRVIYDCAKLMKYVCINSIVMLSASCVVFICNYRMAKKKKRDNQQRGIRARRTGNCCVKINLYTHFYY